MMSLPLVAVLSDACSFDKSPTVPILIFEVGIGVGAIVAYFLLSKLKEKTWQRFLIMATGVLIFELFTAPMWQNLRMGTWAYVYEDVSWILTLGWTFLILSVVLGVDRLLPQWREYQRFGLYLGLLTTIAFPIEILVVNLGIRRYSQEVLEATSRLQVADVPIEALYYIPVFIGLIISFYKYWSFVLDDEPLVPVKRRKWLRGIGLAFLAVFLFEVMIEPMAQNARFPAWSYLHFHDLNFLLMGLWVLIIGVVAVLVTRFFQHLPTLPRFLIAVMIATALAVPIEAELINNGFRIYSTSAAANFSGYLTPIFDIPLEVTFAIPFYMALIIAFIRYWETLLDNRL